MKLLPLLLLASATIASATIASGAGAKPNVVLILIDDFGYECVTANGGESYQTPVMDRLAATGVRFEQCHVQPLCTPTRVQLMTGMSNQRNYTHFGHLDPSQTTFANLLKNAGYTTCITGKWQLSNGFEGPAHFGFDEYTLWQLTRRPGRYKNPGLEINGVPYWDGGYVGNPVLTPFLTECATQDLLIVQINPQHRLGTPRSSQQILDRLNEITFNASLVREIEAIQFVNWHLRNGGLKNAGYREVFMHRIGGGAVAESWTAATKLSASWEFLQHLFDQGRVEADGWLSSHFDAIGVRDTMTSE